MEIVSKAIIAPIGLRSGDTLTVNYTDKEGASHRLVQHCVDEPLMVDTLLVIKTKDAYGLRAGLGVILGEAA